MAEPIEQPQAEGKKEAPKKIGTLESVVNESWHAAKSAAKLTLAALMPYAITKAVPGATLDTLTWTAANVAADATTNFRKGKKHTAGEILKSSAVASTTALPVHYLYKAINKIPLDSALGYVERAAAFGGLAYPTFTGLYQTVDYLIRNLTFKGLGKYLKENYLPTLKRSWKYILPFGLANIFFVPASLQVAVGSAISYIWALFGAPKKGELKEEEKRDKTPYHVAASNVIYKAGSNVFNTFYNIGSAISDYFKTTPGDALASPPAASKASTPPAAPKVPEAKPVPTSQEAPAPAH